MSDSRKIIEQLKRGNKSLLDNIYQEYRDKFIGWASKQFNANEDMAIEIYQASVVTLYENIHSGKLKEITTTIQSYLFAIGRNKFLESVRQNKKVGTIENVSTMKIEEEHVNHHAVNEKYELVSIALKNLGKPCSTLLQYFYFEQNSMEEIATKMDYKNPESAKNQKYKCIKRLRKIVSDLKNNNG